MRVKENQPDSVPAGLGSKRGSLHRLSGRFVPAVAVLLLAGCGVLGAQPEVTQQEGERWRAAAIVTATDGRVEAVRSNAGSADVFNQSFRMNSAGLVLYVEDEASVTPALLEQVTSAAHWRTRGCRGTSGFAKVPAPRRVGV